ncbi:MAG TPA: FAD-dependent oxidoreductase [Dehalococcoidales bacterium]|nr:FAD-dependent oxidoreductase [Dehalococcoidales bacterium]
MKELNTEIVILGGGGAGMAAALTAAEKGCRDITVIEKSGSTAGSTAMAHDIFGAESPVQKRAGVDASCDVLFKRAMEWAHWTKINPRIVRAFIDKSGDTISWLEGMGLEFALAQYFPGQVPWVRHYIISGQGAQLMKTLRRECDSRGVKVLTHTRGEKILRGRGGEIAGVVANGKEEDITVNARSVIVSTGGYGNNKEMLKKYCPYYRDTIIYDGPPANTGDGINMAVAAGAATDGLGSYNMHGPFLSSREAPGMPLDSKGSDGQPLKVRPFELAWEPYTLWVNKNGLRFIDEAFAQAFFAFGNAYALQPEGIGFTLFDSDTLAMMEKQGLMRVGIFGIHTLHMFVPPAVPLPGLSRAIGSYKGHEDILKISSSWDEIAAWMDANPTALKTTIEEYNIACDCGHDALFVKDQRYLRPLRKPPFYAIRCHVSLCDAYGGIKINEKMEVLDTSDKIIPGLYAAGSTTGCWESESYCFHLTGHLVGFALNSGRIAAENAVAYLQGK